MSNDTEDLVQDELAALKTRADRLGISYHPSIGVEKLRAKIAEARAEEPVAPVAAPVAVAAPAPVVETENQKRLRKKKEAEALVRVRITCMNPAKSEWAGEIITAGNSTVGTFRKYVPFNADDGWHVPKIIFNVLRDRQCQVFTTVTDSRGNKVRRGKMIKEFAIEILPSLNKTELDELARRQAMAKAID